MKQFILTLISLLVLFSGHAQTEKGSNPPRGSFGGSVSVGYNYILSSQKTNTTQSNSLFGGNGHALFISFKLSKRNNGLFSEDAGTGSNSARLVTRDGRIIKNEIPPKGKGTARLGFAFTPGIQFGKTSTKDLEAFAKNLTTPSGYKITQNSTNWKQVVVMGGPMLRLGKRNNGLQPLDISATAGAAFILSPRTITIDKVDAAVPGARVFNKTENVTCFAWQVSLSAPVMRLGKRITGCIDAGYGFNGGTVGVSLRLGKRTNHLDW